MEAPTIKWMLQCGAHMCKLLYKSHEHCSYKNHNSWWNGSSTPTGVALGNLMKPPNSSRLDRGALPTVPLQCGHDKRVVEIPFYTSYLKGFVHWWIWTGRSQWQFEHVGMTERSGATKYYCDFVWTKWTRQWKSTKSTEGSSFNGETTYKSLRNGGFLIDMFDYRALTDHERMCCCFLTCAGEFCWLDSSVLAIAFFVILMGCTSLIIFQEMKGI